MIYYKKTLDDECYINDDMGLRSFENICGSQHFEKSSSWTDPDQAHLVREPLGLSVLSHRLSLAHVERMDRVRFDATVAEELSLWAFSAARRAPNAGV